MLDGIDNDNDGDTDDVDDDCRDDARWERATPLCDDGIDNDGDGLVERLDPGCVNELDESELDRESGDLCDNVVDDDADGLIDEEDPGCLDPDGAATRYISERVPECGDGADNDGDGLIDFGSDGDPDCYAAGDISEGQAALHRPTSLILARLARSAPPTTMYIVDGGGGLHVVTQQARAQLPSRTHFGQDVQAQAARVTQTDSSLLLSQEIIACGSFHRR